MTENYGGAKLVFARFLRQDSSRSLTAVVTNDTLVIRVSLRLFNNKLL